MQGAYTDQLRYVRAVAALCTARLIFPTVEAPPEAEPGMSKTGDAHAHDEATDHPERAAVLLTSASGAKAVLAFTGYDALRAWNPDAHPVRCTLDDVAATVIETGSSSIVIDVAGPHPFVVEADIVEHLAHGRRLAELDDGGFAWIWLQEESTEGVRSSAPNAE